MNKLLELDTLKIKKMIYGRSAEIADQMEMRKGLLSKKTEWTYHHYFRGN